jgi:site-specific DNA-methyltransferase (adenine-specific)
MPALPDKSIDMILCDLPYGTTACKWDTIIPFEPLWAQYKRIIKDNGAIVLNCQQPFTSILIISAIDIFRYTWCWNKNYAPNFMNANKMHTKNFEDIAVFYKSQPIYNPQKEQGKPYTDKRKPHDRIIAEVYGTKPYSKGKDCSDGMRSPNGIIKISGKSNKNVHPTQKPVALFEYLIRTYTNEGDTVLDNCAGSGTTGVACENTGRHSILIEREPKYCNIIRERMNALQGRLFI